MALSKDDARDIIAEQLFPACVAERERLDTIDRWYRWDHDRPHVPRQSTREYRELTARAQTPWLGLVVTSVAQALYVDGYRSDADPDNARPWGWWQANGMDRRQIAVHRAALAYGLSYVRVLPGVDPVTGDAMPVMRGVSPRRMVTFYVEPEHDDWPAYALELQPAKVNGSRGWTLSLYDDELVWRFLANGDGSDVTYVEFFEHGVGVPPIVRYANMLDLEGRADGEVEPFIPIAARIDQTTFDRLVVQRFSSWVVRTIAGMAPPDQLEGETAEQYIERTKQRLRVEDILVADDPDTKFGSLPATPLNGFIDAAKADIQALAAVSQTPAHELLGQMANLSAEALAAARASLTAKVEERRYSFGESHEQTLRLAAHVMGDREGAADTGAQVRWRDTETRSLAQAADALGKIATMLGVPVEMLWSKIPGWTQQDVDLAKKLAADGDSFRQLADLLDRQAAGIA
jgi:hypothetical protein